MTLPIIELGPGSRIWVDGDVWVVQSMDDRSVSLRCGTRVRRMLIAEVAECAQQLGLGTEHEAEPSAGVLLSALTAIQRRAVEERACHVRELITHGGGPGNLTDRYNRKAAELGVSVRTLERWVAAYRASGVAGLADSKVLPDFRRR